MDFLDAKVTFPEPPQLAAPSDVAASRAVVHLRGADVQRPAGAAAGGGASVGAAHLVVRFYGAATGITAWW